MKLSPIWLLALCSCTIAAAAPCTLVREGNCRYALVLPDQPAQFEERAALELNHYLAKMCGANVLIQPEEPRVMVEIGQAAQSDDLRQRAAADEDGFFIEVTKRTVRLGGTTPKATLFAVYALLERLGCRWFMPGELGEVVPRIETIRIEPMSLVELPDFKSRQLLSLPEGSEDWALKMKLGGPSCPGAWRLTQLVPPAQYFQANPEYFALVDGQRTSTQLCTSNPKVIEIAAASIIAQHEANPSQTWFGIRPDEGAFCQCESCRALDAGDRDPFTGQVSVSDRLVSFANAVAGRAHERYPEIRLALHTEMPPPRRVQPDPGVIPTLTSGGLCGLHGVENPVCPESNYRARLITEWCNLCPQVYRAGSSYNLGGPGLPVNFTSRWADEIALCKRAGITGFDIQTEASWATHGPLHYVMASLMWDADQDLEALLDDYCHKLYGPAAVPMRRYWSLLDEVRREGAYHTGNAVNIPDLYPPGLTKGLGKLMTAAFKLAGTEPYRERVRVAWEGFRYLIAFLHMRAYSEAFDWLRAIAQLAQMAEVAQGMLDYKPQLIHRGGLDRLNRYWGKAVQQGAERVSEGNMILHPFPDEWRAALDPRDLGEDLLYYSPQVDASSWQRLKTFSASWSDQGLRYYRGVMWYRQEVFAHPTWQGRDLMLWFGAVDETAKVWVNGEFIGESEGDAWEPFELDITHAVRLGQPNLICVKATNVRTDELGTGGIHKPVMIWSPAPQPEPAPGEGD